MDVSSRDGREELGVYTRKKTRDRKGHRLMMDGPSQSETRTRAENKRFVAQVVILGENAVSYFL